MLLKLIQFFVIFLCSDFIHSQTTDPYEEFLEESCRPIPALVIANKTRQLECCEEILGNLYNYWSLRTVYLTRTLDTLQAWNCPQFNETCSKRYLDFTEYTSMVYKRFCNETQLFEECRDPIVNIASSQDLSRNISVSNWSELARSFRPDSLSNSDLSESCIQVALYDATDEGWANYHELITYIVPFCDPVWCGFDYDTINRYDINLLTCFSTRCKASLFILLSALIVFAIAITIANLTVILVYSLDAKSRHSQGIFRLALGIADIMVGLIVLPAAIHTLWKTYQHPIALRAPFNVTGQEYINNSNQTEIYRNETVTYERVISRRQELREIFPFSFQAAAGFFNTLSLVTSVYLLTVSGVDRLQAIARPVHYRQFTAKRFATGSTIICYAVACLVSFLPIVLDGVGYTITGSGLVTLSGNFSLILYLIAFVIPLIVTWLIAIMMFVQGQKSFRRRASMASSRNRNVQQQARLNKILSLMVIAFTLSVLPTILILIAVLFIPNKDPSDLKTYDPSLNNITNSLEIVAVIFLLSNSLWNCAIYSIRTKNFRKKASEIYKRIWNFINPLNVYRKLVKCCLKRKFERKKSYQTSVKTPKSNGTFFQTHSTSCNTSSPNSSPKMKRVSKSAKTKQTSPSDNKSANTKL